MKRTDGFLLKYIEGVPYLLPYGQRIAQHRRNLRLNETSAFIWNILPECNTKEALFQKMISHWEAKTPEDCNELWTDLQDILDQFEAFGLIYCACEKDHAAFSGKCYQIAGIHVKIAGAPDALYDYFAPYAENDDHSPDLTIRIHLSHLLSTAPIEGQQIIYDSELCIVRHENENIFYFPSLTQILEVHADLPGTSADIFCLPPFGITLSEQIFPVIRLLFNRYAQRRKMLFLHSASLLYKDKAWLFSGSSGTGKSTHTNLWHKLFGTKILNGDLNLLALKERTPVIYGTPWCGTSGISDAGCHPLGGIVLLKQDTKNHLEDLDPDEQIIHVLQRIISPCETDSDICKNLEVIEGIVHDTPVYRLHCTKEPQAAIYMKEQIDALI